MKSFISRHADHVMGVLSGFDRLVFRGRLRQLCYPDGLRAFLNSAGVLLKHFGGYAEDITDRLKQASLQQARQEKRPVRYLASSKIRKVPRTHRYMVSEKGRRAITALLAARNSDTESLVQMAA